LNQALIEEILEHAAPRDVRVQSLEWRGGTGYGEVDRGGEGRGDGAGAGIGDVVGDGV
jgi:hypothetical protein